MCVYVYMYIYMYLHTYVHMYVCTYVLVCISKRKLKFLGTGKSRKYVYRIEKYTGSALSLVPRDLNFLSV